MTIRKPPKQDRTRSVEARLHEMFEELGRLKERVRSLERLLRLTGAKAEIPNPKLQTNSNFQRKTETTAPEFCPPSDV